MAYRLRYQVAVDWVTPGRGTGTDYATGLGIGFAGSNAQTIVFGEQTNVGSNTFLAADITALLAALSVDISAQMNAAPTLARIQAFSSGGN